MGKGLDRFTEMINTEVDKVKDAGKRKYYRGSMDNLISHITDICDDEVDALLAQEHKTFARAWKYIVDKAKKCAINGCACIDDPIVYGWFDEYLGTDDKAQVEAEEKKLKEAKAKSMIKPVPKPSSKPSAPEKQVSLFGDDEPDDVDDGDDVEEVKSSTSANTQMSIFDLM